ncbi:MAG: ABC transporter permease, partial [Spirochaetaceae bacterium]
VWMVIVLTLVAGIVIGAVNGLVITRLKVYPFIATLGMLYVARGLAGLRNNGRTFANLVGRQEFNNTGFVQLGGGTLLGVPYSVWIMFLFALVAYYVTTKLPFGRHVYALGGNRRVAELSGVRVRRTETMVYIISGFCSAMVGLIIASQLVAAHPATGMTYELTAIAAVVLGGTSLMGGRGGIGGTIIGAFVIGVLVDGLVVMGYSSFLQNVIKGTVIVLAVFVDLAQIQMQERIALQKQAAVAIGEE